MPVASNGTGTAPSKSEPSADVVDPGQATAAAIARPIAAASSPPVAVGQKPIPIRPAGRGDPADLVVGQVADRVDGSPGRRCGTRRPAGSRAPGRRRSCGSDAWATSTSIERRLHPGDQLAAGRGQPALVDAVGRPAEVVVEEMGRRHHPESGVDQPVDVGRVAVERVGALDRQEGRRDRRVGTAPGEVGRRDRPAIRPGSGVPPSPRPSSGPGRPGRARGPAGSARSLAASAGRARAG